MNEDLIKIGIPLLLGIIASIVSYFLGKKAGMKVQKGEKGMELGQAIVNLFQDITALEDRLHQFYKSNYAHLRDVDRAVDNFEKMETLYEPEHKAVQEFSDKKNELEEKIKEGRHYFKGSILQKTQIYLDLLKFKYDEDVFGSKTSFHRQMFLNLTDPKADKKRKKIRGMLSGKLRKLQG